MRRWVLSLILVLILWAVFERYPPNNKVKALIVGVWGVSYLFNWAQMLIYRRIWPMRSIGIFWTIFGDSLYWLAILSVFLVGTIPGWIVPLILASVAVGAPALDIGTIRYITRHSPPPSDPPTGLP